MKFEPNKYYKHEIGTYIHTLAEVDTLTYGRTIVAETGLGLVSIDIDQEDLSNWLEVTKDEYMFEVFGT